MCTSRNVYVHTWRFGEGRRRLTWGRQSTINLSMAFLLYRQQGDVPLKERVGLSPHKAMGVKNAYRKLHGGHRPEARRKNFMCEKWSESIMMAHLFPFFLISGFQFSWFVLWAKAPVARNNSSYSTGYIEEKRDRGRTILASLWTIAVCSAWWSMNSIALLVFLFEFRFSWCWNNWIPF